MPAVRRTPWLAIVGLVALALIGGASATTRGVAVWRVLEGAPADELSPQDAENLRTLAAWMRVDAGSPLYRQIELLTHQGSARYSAMPITTLMHIVPGAIFLFAAPLQLIPRFRSRRPGIHRRLGYLLLALAVPYALTGIFLSIHEPVFGPLAAVASGSAGVWFIYCAVRAYVAIRRREIDRHREWMLRMLAVAYGIATVRLSFLPIIAVIPIDAAAAGALSFWTGWLIATLLTEWWIRRSRPAQQRALRWAS